MKFAGALVLVAALAGCGGSGQPHFAAAPGWHARSTEGEAWASTLPFKDCRGCVPQRTIAALPPGGIVIQVRSIGTTRVSPARATWPPRVRLRDVSPGSKGIELPHREGFSNIAVQESNAAWQVYYWFGRNHPTPGQLALANAEVMGFSR